VAMRLTAAEQHALGVIDEVIAEPAEGAHEDPDETARRLRERIVRHLDTLAGRDRQALVDARYARYRRMGEFTEVAVAAAGARTERRPGRPHARALLESGRTGLAGDGALAGGRR
jgi:hypothetical protein